MNNVCIYQKYLYLYIIITTQLLFKLKKMQTLNTAKTLVMPTSYGLSSFDMEIYTKHPVTGETGWNIENVRVYGKDRAEALENVKRVPNFDCVILANTYASALDNTDLKFTNQGIKFLILA